MQKRNAEALLLHRTLSLLMLLAQQRDKHIPAESQGSVRDVSALEAPGADCFVGGVISTVCKELLEAPPEDRWENRNQLQIHTGTRAALPKGVGSLLWYLELIFVSVLMNKLWILLTGAVVCSQPHTALGKLRN